MAMKASSFSRKPNFGAMTGRIKFDKKPFSAHSQHLSCDLGTQSARVVFSARGAISFAL